MSALKYDSLHRQCRTLESLFDVKLTSYSRLASVQASDDDIESNGAASRSNDLELELDDLLEKLKEMNEQLGALSNGPDDPLSPSMLRTVQRHYDVYQDYCKETRRAKINVQQALDHANLLSGVRNDIDAYKSSAADSLLAERGRIDSSHRMVDDTLEQAYATRSEFSSQRLSLGTINTRMAGVMNTIPGINNLVSMIRSRRRRDSIIMGLLIAVCIIIILTYLWQ
ncbi:v-SNARE protein [Pterulicium gracile]|uniref:Golgi SNAP receptor complex member 1 n=1 Tax=Pterulicium gracile TaxID=1884261 RepID=A0A5C3QQ17_9AGAR|nr:v-SNARE protein [Pterula gracilis]